MTYRILRQDARADQWQVMFVEGVSLDGLRAGLPLDSPAAPAQVTVSALGTERSDFLELPCPVVSDAMRRALEGAGVDNVQYFPAHVEVEYGESEGAVDYWIANVVGAVACADAHVIEPPPASDASVEDEPASGFRVDPVRVRGFDLFRLAEDRRLLIVSSRVAAALGAAGLRGIVLQQPETYTGRRVRTTPPEAETGDHG